MRHEPVVLIVDSKDIYDAMAPALSRELQTTHLLHCDSLEKAMEVIDSDARIDLIFSDWELTGPSFIDAVRKDNETKHTPLVMTSNLDTDTVIANAMRHGASDHLSKPFLEKGLINKLHRVMRTQERRRKKRLHPDHDCTIEIELQHAGKIEAHLIDFSLEGFLTRASNQICRKISMGDTGIVHLVIDNYSVDLECRLFRIEEDSTLPEPQKTILVTFRFIESHEERVDKLEQMLDEFDAIW